MSHSDLPVAIKSLADYRSAKFSRACVLCLVKDPCERSFFELCGHVICRGCGEQLHMDATFADRDPACPVCSRVSQVVTLVEDHEKDYDEFVRKFRRGLKERLSASLAQHGPCDGTRPEYREMLVIKLLERDMEPEAYFEMCCDSIKKEARRLAAEVPEDEDCTEQAQTILIDTWENEMRALICHLRNENEKSPSSTGAISRVCLNCDVQSPINRSVFTACGHIVCGECTAKMTKTDPSCPKCNCKSAIVHLFEDIIA